MGKAERFQIQNPDSPATNRQTYTIYLTTGIDVRECQLTKSQASDTIDLVNQGKAYHARQAMIELGGAIKARDVHKNHRKDPKPRAKATPKESTSETDLLRELLSKVKPEDLLKLVKSLDSTPTEEPKPVEKPKARSPRAKTAKPKPKTKAEELGIEPVDISSPAVQSILKRFAATGRF